MSHFSKIKTRMVEKEHLLKAIKDLGYNYVEGDQELNSFGNVEQVQIRIPIALSYDIGLRQTQNGYEVVADWWGVRGINQADFVQKLTQRYAYHAAVARMQEQGFTLAQEEIGNQGQIRLVMRRTA